MDAKQELLRHTLGTVAYRGGKAIRDAPASFGAFKASPSTRTPLEILAHICDLFEWARSAVEGNMKWVSAGPLSWDEERKRFFETLGRLDACLQAALTHLSRWHAEKHRPMR